MSCSSTHDAINAQLRCPLLQAPYDIKREIFNHLIPSSVHIFQNRGKLEISDCAGRPSVPRNGVSRFNRKEGLPDGPTRDERWARRLRSSWGFHWKCEERMLEAKELPNGDKDGSCCTTDALMRTCKKLQLDVSDHLSQDTIIIVTDIATLHALLHNSTSFMRHKFHRVRNLDINFNLPIDVMTAIELQSTGWSAHALPKDRSNERAFEQAALWLRLGPALGRLECLKKCDFWLDHNSPEYWWEFNEAAILAPLLSLANRDDVDLVVSLPSHAADDVPTPPFEIQRRLRQSRFGVEDTAGRLSVIYKVQFPVLEELISFITELDGSEEQRAEERRTMEREEREAWREGKDIKKHLDMLLGDLGPHQNYGI